MSSDDEIWGRLTNWTDEARARSSVEDHLDAGITLCDAQTAIDQDAS